MIDKSDYLVEPGYVSTPIAVVASAFTILEERDKIPSGVLVSSF